MDIKYFSIIDNSSVKAEQLKKIFFSTIPNNWVLDDKKSEYVFVFGGDGTFLRNKDKYSNKKVIPINAGNLGYYSYFCKKNIKEISNKTLNDKNFEQIEQLVIEINNNRYCALNEILIRSNQVINTKIYINSILLEQFKGSGLMFSTPLGSTAHTKNVNGSIIAPNINVIQMVEIEPLTQKKYNSLKSPLIMDSTTKINLYSKNDQNAFIIIDGYEIKEKFVNESTIKSEYSNFFIFKPNNKKSYWKKIRDSFVRD